MLRLGGIVLCGGASRRMGRAKAWLEFGSEYLLQRMVRRIAPSVDPLVVVAAPEQELPRLPPEVLVARDPVEYRGPLQGLQVGLATLAPHVEAAFVTSVDAPFLKPEWIQALASQLKDFDLVVPRDERFFHPLAAIYRTRLVDRIESLLQADRFRPFDLIETARSQIIPVDTLRSVDPELISLTNLNTPEDYEQARSRMGNDA